MSEPKAPQAETAPTPQSPPADTSRHRWLGKPGPPTDPHRPQRTLTLILLASLLLPFVVACFEWQRYRWNRTFFPALEPWGAWDAVPLWVLALKTYLVLLPATLVAAALAWRAWTRSAAAVFLFASMLVIVWAGIDVETFTRTGVHVTYYAQFVGAPDATKWMGNVGGIARDAAFALLPVLGASALAVVTAGVLATLAWRGRASPSRAPAGKILLLILAHAMMLIGVVPAQVLLTPTARRSELQRVHDLLPYNLEWTAPGSHVVDADAFRDPLNERLEPLLRTAVPRMFAGPPADTSPEAVPDPASPRPDVVLIVLDSLRYDAMVPQVMPRLSALARQGVVLRQHHAGARITHLGLFTLFYGRTAGLYRTTLRAGVPPQACVSLRAAGYQTNYVSGVGHFAWARMQAFLNEPMFDRLRIVGLQDWPTSDRRALAVSKRLLTGDNRPLTAEGARVPQYLGVFLASTHYPYVYPPEFETRTPVAPPDWNVLTADRERDRTGLINRYHNSVSFLDAAVGDFVDSLDRSNTVIIIVGDHGESFWDDGFLTHGTRWSDVQSHVPCVILAPNLPPRQIDGLTTHDDLLPTLLHLVSGKPVQPGNVTGRDLFAPGPPRAMAVTAADAQLTVFELLVRIGDRRVLLEFRENLPRVIVRGTVDAYGNIDGYDLPPGSEAPLWATHIEDLVHRMTDLAPAPR
jgi:hypothetical protein